MFGLVCVLLRTGFILKEAKIYNKYIFIAYIYIYTSSLLYTQFDDDIISWSLTNQSCNITTIKNKKKKILNPNICWLYIPKKSK